MKSLVYFALVLLVQWNPARSQDPPPSPSPSPTPAPEWRTLDHSPGRCAMYGTCGHRRDGDPLACAANVAAAAPSEALAASLRAVCPSLWAERGGEAGRYCCTTDQVERVRSDTSRALPFIVGCPACHHNFVQLWCLLICSPDQATFANITAVQVAPDTGAPNAVAEVDYWLTTSYSDALYDSCKDVKFGAANLPAMSFIGGGAKNGQQWLDFLGTLKDKRVPPIGSPIQINFRPENSTAPGLVPMKARVVSCGDNGFRCSCSDCPAAEGCAQPDPDPPGPPPEDSTCRLGTLSCLTFALVWVYGILAVVVLVAYDKGRLGGGAPGAWRGGAAAAGQGAAVTKSGGGADDAGALLEPLLAGAGGTAGSGGSGAGTHTQTCGVPPVVERYLQRWYLQLGLLVGRYPVAVVGYGTALIAVCCLGLIWFRVETDPQRLWVGPTSQAAREKASYETSFGPFYRVEQMILATRPAVAAGAPAEVGVGVGSALAAGAAAGSGSGAPPIVTPANIRLMFELQQLVDELEASLEEDGHLGYEGYDAGGGSPRGERRVVRLSDICYKPFGDACATQSVLQYWQMSRTVYESEQARKGGATPEYCFNNWFTQCRSTFQAPMDPHVVLGGFPVGPEFTTYSAGTTAFVVTFPVSSDSALRPAAMAWERAFVDLATHRLAPAAEAANLTLSFSTERSVQDELSRESRADAGTVAASYGIMLLYIAAALGSFPPPAAVWWAARGRGLAAAGQLLRRAALTSRASLGLAGVVIVAASVAGALGLVSFLGLWCTLIIMEVIPFLVLAVGVDNMFVLAAAMANQSHTLPPEERLALALSSAGPSITLAATCEVTAFALGGLLTSMPAVRNFSLAAAAAVALDFVLQVTVFAALLVLDVRRLESRRVDCLPCVQLGPEEESPREAAERRAAAAAAVAAAAASDGGAPAGVPYTPPAGAAMEYDKDDEPPCIVHSSEGEVDEHTYWSLQRVLQAYFERVHAPLLAQPAAQVAVLLLFGASLMTCLGALPALQVGLDQAVALPRDSYLQPYFRDVMRYLRVGPPLLLVVRDLDLDPAARQVERVCAVAGCDQDSLLNRVSAAARSPRRSYIAAPAASWLDDFMSWLSPDLPACCRSQPGGGGAAGSPLPEEDYCPPPDQPPCAANASACATCATCVQTAFSDGRPSVSQFQSYLPWFLAARPSVQCAKGGMGAYSDALQRARPDDPTSVAGLMPTDTQPGLRRGDDGEVSEDGEVPADGEVPEDAVTRRPSRGYGDGGWSGVANSGGGGGGRVAASSFRTYYPPLNRQSDFIQALRHSRAFAAKASRELRLDVYAYSLFHVFFEQYLSVLYDATAMVGLPLLAVVGATWALSGSLWSAGLLAAVLASLLVHLGGAMLLAGIQVNAVSLVNLAMALGIAVEFCAHVMHAYMVATPPSTPAPSAAAPRAADGRAAAATAALRASRAARSRSALVSVGSSVLSGVTLTKLVGVAVLAFARTQIFEVYYFRLYLALVVAGAAHGLVLLPVLLALAGPPSWRSAA